MPANGRVDVFVGGCETPTDGSVGVSTQGSDNHGACAKRAGCHVLG